MLENALKLLKEIVGHGYQAYIVGGFVRDYLLGIESNDIDINTNATPKEIKQIFSESSISSEDYGSVTLVKYNTRFEITTFRREIKYANNRKPVEIEYINDLYQDLIRRDFTINSICMDSDGNIIDLLGGRDDLAKRIVRCIGSSSAKFSEDALRMLRAVRFAAILNFSLDAEAILAIQKNKYLLLNLSYYRKKEELDKIFVSSNAKLGIKLLLDLGLADDLELSNLKNITYTDSLIGIWAILNVTDKYPFTNNEKSLIKDINYVLKHNNLDPYILYKYGLYVNSVASDIKGEDKKRVTKAYANMAIHKRSDLAITCDDIVRSLNKKPGSYLKDIYLDIEKEVLYRRLPNTEESIITYVVKKYS